MKKITGILVLIAAGMFVQAQTDMTTTTTTTTTRTSSGKTIGFQIRAGVNFQNLNGKIAGDEADGDLMTSFHAGVELPIMIAPEFYIQPGALYSMKGAVDKDNSDIKTQISYIEIPVNFVYKPMLGTGNLILGVGPYMGIAIGGKVKDPGGDEDLQFEDEVSLIDFGLNPRIYYRRLDFGGNLLFGFQFGHFLIQGNAQLGMTNILPEIQGTDKDNYKLKNTGFGVSVGFTL